MVRRAKTSNILNCVVAALRQWVDVVNLCVPQTLCRLEARVLTALHFTQMISAFSPYRNDQRIAFIRARTQNAGRWPGNASVPLRCVLREQLREVLSFQTLHL
jgi:hypothetical protein